MLFTKIAALAITGFPPLGDEPIADIGGTVARHEAELRDLGWRVEVVPGRDHLGATAVDVVPPRLSRFPDDHLLRDRTAHG
ncbi:hypothetical protein [Saccharothrix sp. Mg75]|uniref:hypothetical protein n=1 Tax=Saccharothrix sp. Mg75 TaxID=3445357 RepID=UPI003EEA954C